MHFFPLRKTIQDHFGIPVYLNNDANCLIYGESIFGAAADKKNVVGFTLGTGIGCAVVLDKKILNGSTGTAGEIWPIPYQSGIIEDIVSGGGVSKIYKSISGSDKSSFEVYKMALDGDIEALQTWNEFGKHLAVPIAWSINLIDPEVVILGGSITGAYLFFKDSMEEHLRRWICPVPAERTKVITAKLGDYAGFIGAACLVTENR
jgi:glucokinase